MELLFIFNFILCLLIAHEFGNTKHFYLIGIELCTFYHNYQDGDMLEHSAVSIENRIRSYYGDPLKYNSYESDKWFKSLFYPTWKNYFNNIRN